MGNAKQNNESKQGYEKPLRVFIGAHETQDFLNDIIKTSKNKIDHKNEIKPWWFWLGFLGGVLISGLGIFFTFTTVYFIQNSILEKPNFIYEKAICEKH